MLNKSILLPNETHSQTLFFTKGYKHSPSSDTLQIILSPEFYWCRKVAFPLKSEKDAKLLLKPFFEEMLGDIKGYEFVAVSLDNQEFLAIAYEPKKLIEEFFEANITLSQIQNIYFGVVECKHLSIFRVGQKIFAYSDGVLVHVPNTFAKIDSIQALIPGEMKLSRYSFSLTYANKYMSDMTLYTIFAIGFCIALLYAWQAIVFFNQADANIQKIEELKQSHNLPASKMQLESMVIELQKRFSHQSTLRKKLATILDYSLVDSKAKIENFELINDTFIVIFIDADENSLREYFAQLQDVSIINKHDKWRLEIKL